MELNGKGSVSGNFGEMSSQGAGVRSGVGDCAAAQNTFLMVFGYSIESNAHPNESAKWNGQA